MPLVVGIGLALMRNRVVQGLGLTLLIVWLVAGYWSYRIA